MTRDEPEILKPYKDNNIESKDVSKDNYDTKLAKNEYKDNKDNKYEGNEKVKPENEKPPRSEKSKPENEKNQKSEGKSENKEYKDEAKEKSEKDERKEGKDEFKDGKDSKYEHESKWQPEKEPEIIDPYAMVSREALVAHVEALESSARTLRHFIESAERPDLRRGALTNEPDGTAAIDEA